MGCVVPTGQRETVHTTPTTQNGLDARQVDWRGRDLEAEEELEEAADAPDTAPRRTVDFVIPSPQRSPTRERDRSPSHRSNSSFITESDQQEHLPGNQVNSPANLFILPSADFEHVLRNPTPTSLSVDQLTRPSLPSNSSSTLSGPMLDAHLLMMSATTPMNLSENAYSASMSDSRSGDENETDVVGDPNPHSVALPQIYIPRWFILLCEDSAWITTARRNYSGGFVHSKFGCRLLTASERKSIRQTELQMDLRLTGVSGKGMLYHHPHHGYEPLPLHCFPEGALRAKYRLRDDVEKCVVVAADEIRLRLSRNEVRHALRVLECALDTTKRTKYLKASAMLMVLERAICSYFCFLSSPEVFIAHYELYDFEERLRGLRLRGRTGRLRSVVMQELTMELWDEVNYALAATQNIMLQAMALPFPPKPSILH